MSEALEFLSALRPNGPWTLSAILGDKVPTRTCRTIGEAGEFIASYGDRANLYYQPNRTKAVSRKAALADLTSLEFAHVDIDRDASGARLTSNEQKAVVIATLRKHSPPPSFIIDSGNGIQALWRFVIPLAVAEAEALTAINRGLAAKFGGDMVPSPAQLMRLPGTTNWPDEKKVLAGLVVVEARLIEANAGAYDPDDFPRGIAPAPAATAAITLPPAMEVASLDVLDEWRVSPKIREIIEHGYDLDKPDAKPSRSESRMHVAVALAGCGVPAGIIQGVFLNPDFAISAGIDEARGRTAEQQAARETARAMQYVANRDWKDRPVPKIPDMSDNLDALPLERLHELFKPDNLAKLAEMRRTDKRAYEALLHRWTLIGFAGCDALDKEVVKALRKPKKQEAPAAAETVKPAQWPRPLNYEKLNPAGAARLFRDSRPKRLINSDGIFYELTAAGLWVEIDEAWLKSEIRATDPIDRLAPNFVIACISGLADLTKVRARPYEWLNASATIDPRNLVLFRNGLLDVIGGDLMPLDGSYFATATPAYDYEPEAQCPAWLAYLNERLANSYIPTLQEFCGLYLVADNTPQRCLVFVGPPRSGKGTIKGIMEDLIGPAHRISKAMTDLAQPFGLQEIPDKRLLIIPDARSIPMSVRNAALERILLLTGGDSVPIPRKYKSAISIKSTTRLLILGNRQLEWIDEAGALSARQVNITFRRSFEGAEDMSFPARLQAELPGIANWAIEGLKRLRSNGYQFTIGDAAKADMLEARRSFSPIQRFADLRLIITDQPADYARASEVFRAYRFWAEDVEGLPRGLIRSREQMFGDLIAAFPGVQRGQRRIDRKRTHVLAGLRLKQAQEGDTEDETEIPQ